MGARDPAGCSFGFDAADTALRQPTGLEFVDRLPASPEVSVGVSLFAALERPGGVDLLDTLLAEARDLMIGPSSPQRTGVTLETVPAPLPEFQGTPGSMWQPWTPGSENGARSWLEHWPARSCSQRRSCECRAP